MNVAVIGYARQGKSSFDYWNVPGNTVTICDEDKSIQLPIGAKGKLGEDYLKGLNDYDLIIRTPKLHPSKIAQANPEAPNILQKVTSNTQEFFNVCPTKNIIGVTGTKGKGTTSTLITELLRASGETVHLGGNIGIPPLELLNNHIKPDDWVVLELANFQLIDCPISPHIAVCLMIADDHLDWHTSRTEYIDAKKMITRHQTENDIAVFFNDNAESKEIASVSAGVKIPYFADPGAIVEDGYICINGQRICTTSEVGLLGAHNLENICAALTAFWQVSQNTEVARRVLQTFKGLPFRIEKRRTLKNIDIYNDSFSSNPSATVAAIRSIAKPTVLILGGRDRGIDLGPLCTVINETGFVKEIILIGEAQDRAAHELAAAGINTITKIESSSLQEIVSLAFSKCSPGEALLFSPGFPSFDMFKDFEDRGQQFNKAVNMLKPYQEFIFESYNYEHTSKELSLHYSLDSEVFFTEKFIFNISLAAGEDAAVQNRAFELLFLLCGVSYYKTYLPEKIIVKGAQVDEKLATFLSKTYEKGLGEFFYVNQLNPLTKITFPVNSAPLVPVNAQHNTGNLIGIGGGKDSLLTLELLRETNPTTWACNHAEKLQPLVSTLGTDHISVDRVWDSSLTELNATGALNGHVPISAILAAAGISLAVLTGKQNVIVSNESSANAPTLTYEGVEVNHQYSKTIEFEYDFQEILAHLFGASKQYFSLLRPYTEIGIAKRFVPYFNKYSSVFCSCNKAFTQKSSKMEWCENCAKCAFTYLIFAPFIGESGLSSVFSENLLHKESLRPEFEQLLGINGVKPLECVGEVEECIVAFNQAKISGVATLDLAEVDTPIDYDPYLLRPHLIPSEFTRYILD